MSNLVMWSLIVGFLAPPVISVIQQPKWSDTARAVFTSIFAVVAGGATAYFNGEFRAGDIVGTILVIGVAAITFYRGFFKPTGISPAIENATSKTPPTAQQAHPDRPGHRGAIDPLYLIVLVIAVLLAVWLLMSLVGRA